MYIQCIWITVLYIAFLLVLEEKKITFGQLNCFLCNIPDTDPLFVHRVHLLVLLLWTSIKIANCPDKSYCPYTDLIKVRCYIDHIPGQIYDKHILKHLLKFPWVRAWQYMSSVHDSLFFIPEEPEINRLSLHNHLSNVVAVEMQHYHDRIDGLYCQSLTFGYFHFVFQMKIWQYWRLILDQMLGAETAQRDQYCSFSKFRKVTKPKQNRKESCWTLCRLNITTVLEIFKLFFTEVKNPPMPSFLKSHLLSIYTAVLCTAVPVSIMP